MRKLGCDPEIETIGFNMLALINNVNASDIRPLLEKHNLVDIDPDTWYPAQKWMAVFNEMGSQSGGMFNFVAVGMSVAEKLPIPPEMSTLEAVLENWNALYQMQHRGGDIGYVDFEKRSDKHYVTIHNHLYPDDFNYGLAYGFAKRFSPAGTHFTVKYDDHEPRLDEGGERTLIHVTWE